MNRRFNWAQLAWACIAYGMWNGIYPRRLAYNNAVADWLLSWAGVWAYREMNDEQSLNGNVSTKGGDL